MAFYVEPFMESSLADRVMHYHFGMSHPDRKRTKILNGVGFKLGKKTRRGSGTLSMVASVALPLLLAEVGRQAAVAACIERGLRRLEMDAVFDRDPGTETQQWRRDVSRRFTAFLERLGRTESEVTVDKGRVVRIGDPWAQITVGDPRNDAYRLERVPAEQLVVSGLDTERRPFLRVVIHEKGRKPLTVFLPGWDTETGPSPAIKEMMSRAKPGKRLSEGDPRFGEKRREA